MGGALGKTSQIQKLTLVNKKDKPETIHEIYFVIKNNYYSYCKPKEPLILPANGSCIILPDEVTYYTLNSQKTDMAENLNPFFDYGFSIYLKLNKKIYRAYNEAPNSEYPFFSKRGIETGGHFTATYGGEVVPQDARYAIDYSVNNEKKVAFILKTGLITWGYFPNMIDKIKAYDNEKLQEILRTEASSYAMDYIMVTKLDYMH